MRPVNPQALFRIAAAAALLLTMVGSLAATSGDQTSYAQTSTRATRTPTRTPNTWGGRAIVTPTPDPLDGLGGTGGNGSTSGILADDQVSGVIVGIDTTSNPPRVLVQPDTAAPTYANDPALMPGAVMVYISDPAILPGLGLGMTVTFGGTQFGGAGQGIQTGQGLYANEVAVEGEEDLEDPYATDDIDEDPYADDYGYDNYDYGYDNYGYDNYDYGTSDYDNYEDNYDDNYDDSYDDNYYDNWDDGIDDTVTETETETSTFTTVESGTATTVTTTIITTVTGSLTATTSTATTSTATTGTTVGTTLTGTTTTVGTTTTATTSADTATTLGERRASAQTSTTASTTTLTRTVSTGSRTAPSTSRSASTTSRRGTSTTSRRATTTRSTAPSGANRRPAAASAPSAPSGLTATAIARDTIELTWVDNSNNESGFRIDKSRDGTNWQPMVQVGPNHTSVRSTRLALNRTHYYRVSAFNKAGQSAPSEVASAKTKS